MLRRRRAMVIASYANMRFLLAVGSSGEHRGGGCGRSTAARGMVLSPLKQSRGGRCRVTSVELAGERTTSSERKLPMHPSHLLVLGFLLAVGSSGEHRGGGCGRPRSTLARELVLSPLKQSRGRRYRVTSVELAGERTASSERKLPMHPSHLLVLGF